MTKDRGMSGRSGVVVGFFAALTLGACAPRVEPEAPAAKQARRVPETEKSDRKSRTAPRPVVAPPPAYGNKIVLNTRLH